MNRRSLRLGLMPSRRAFSVFGNRANPVLAYHDVVEHFDPENRDHWLRIQMLHPDASSLNLSNCAALALIEALRQHGFVGETGGCPLEVVLRLLVWRFALRGRVCLVQ